MSKHHHSLLTFKSILGLLPLEYKVVNLGIIKLIWNLPSSFRYYPHIVTPWNMPQCWKTAQKVAFYFINSLLLLDSAMTLRIKVPLICRSVAQMSLPWFLTLSLTPFGFQRTTITVHWKIRVEMIKLALCIVRNGTFLHFLNTVIVVLWKPKGVDDKVKNQGNDICAALRQINGTFIRKVIAESRRRRRHRLCHRARRSVLQTASIRRARGGAPLHWRQFCGLLLKIPFHFLTTVYCNLYCISIDELMSWFIFVHHPRLILLQSFLRPHFWDLILEV